MIGSRLVTIARIGLVAGALTLGTGAAQSASAGGAGDADLYTRAGSRPMSSVQIDMPVGPDVASRCTSLTKLATGATDAGPGCA